MWIDQSSILVLTAEKKGREQEEITWNYYTKPDIRCASLDIAQRMSGG